MPARPFRFGVQTEAVASAEGWQEQVRRAEALGYATLCTGDHLHTHLGPIAALAAAASVTTALRLGCAVFANDFRHPVLLAKEAASLDVLSGGRFELGLGTGYWRADYDQSGLPFDPPGARVTRLTEAVQLLKQAFAQDNLTFDGATYHVRDFTLVPRPVQRPRPPLLIGGGSRRILTLAGRESDIVGINVRTTPDGDFDWDSLTPEATAQKIAWVREAAGERFTDLELHWLVPFVAITDAPHDAAAAMLGAWGVADRVDVEQFLTSPHVLIGTEEAIVAAVQERRDRYGVSYLSVFAHAMETFAPIVARLQGT